MADGRAHRNPHLVMALAQCRGRSIADNALHRAVSLSRYFRVTIVSDAFPDAVPEPLRCAPVAALRFGALRRFAHVPDEVALARAVYARLRRLQRDDPIDFVLCHGYTLTRLAGHALRRHTGTPCGMFMHGHIFSRPPGTYDARLTAWYRWLAPRCYRSTDLILALSPAQRTLAVAAGATPERVIVAPNGIEDRDVGLDARAAAAAPARPRAQPPLRILYVGRLAVEKGVDVLLDACARLVAMQIDFVLTLIGSGPQHASLRAACTRLGLDDRVRLLGAVARHELGAHYLDADVLCVPSRDEPLGSVVLEGMVAGCLVVASRTGGIPSMLRDGIDGVLVPPADAAALARALASAAHDGASMQALARAGCESVAARFGWAAIGDHIRAALVERLGIRAPAVSPARGDQSRLNR